jgi:hypothetical protein
MKTFMKSICGTIMSELPDFIEGKLDEDENRLVQKHIIECPACLREEQNVREIFGSLSSQSSFIPPAESYWNTIVPRIHEEIDRRRSGFHLIPTWIYRIVLPLAAVSLVIVVLFRTGIFPPSGTSEELWISVQQMSPEEQTAVINDFAAALPENTEEYTVDDSAMIPLRSDASEAVRSESNEYMDEYQFAPETLLESLSAEEVEQVITKLQTQQRITS